LHATAQKRRSRFVHLLMHMHVHQHADMRTTIELPDEQRAKLLELVAKRGEKGFSGLIQEAVAAYLEQHATGSERVKRALALRGSLRGDEGEALLEATEEARPSWR
jgi:hypothetical protein